MREDDVRKTALLCHQGTFEFTRMAFGVAGGPASFQTLMGRVLNRVNHQFSIAFMDDVVVFRDVEQPYRTCPRSTELIRSAVLTMNRDKVQ
ncbi:hypothetical protein HPB47_018271, partial [Ixodes persulcatus]